jgi:hypothetical protein
MRKIVFSREGGLLAGELSPLGLFAPDLLALEFLAAAFFGAIRPRLAA